MYKSEIPYSSESETLFVFTVITRSQNIGRPLLKRFPSCAIVCLCIIITAATFTVSVRQPHWEYFLYEFSSISVCTYTYYTYALYLHTHTHTHFYIKFHPYFHPGHLHPLKLWLFQRAATHKTVYDIIYILNLPTYTREMFRKRLPTRWR